MKNFESLVVCANEMFRVCLAKSKDGEKEEAGGED